MHTRLEEKIYLFTYLDKGCCFGHPFAGIFEKYFLTFTYLQWEQCFGHPNRQKIFTPLLIPTGKAQMHTLFERKFLISLTYLQWERVFFKSVFKISSHLFGMGECVWKPKIKNILTNSHCDTPIYKGVLKNWHKKRRLSCDKRQKID